MSETHIIGAVRPPWTVDDLLIRAEIYAGEKHAGQLRKDGVTPYISHPAAIVASLRLCGMQEPEVLAAAWLHDVVEDTDATLDDIFREFGPAVGSLVGVLTKWTTREAYYAAILSAEPRAKLVKMVDLEHNCRTLRYLSEKGAQRKLSEVREVYVSLEAELEPLYSCGWLFDEMRAHIRRFEQA